MTWLETLLQFIEEALFGERAVPQPLPINTPPMPPQPMPQPVSTPSAPKITVTQFCKALENLEGYFPPSAQHPGGTTAWKNRNPGNLRCPPLHSGATVCRNNFNVFPDYATGFKAQEDNIVFILKLNGQKNAAGYSSNMSLLEFFELRDPPGDNNNPLSCALNVGNQLGVSIHYKLSNLII